jgi:hypothetical protein
MCLSKERHNDLVNFLRFLAFFLVFIVVLCVVETFLWDDVKQGIGQFAIGQFFYDESISAIVASPLETNPLLWGVIAIRYFLYFVVGVFIWASFCLQLSGSRMKEAHVPRKEHSNNKLLVSAKPSKLRASRSNYRVGMQRDEQPSLLNVIPKSLLDIDSDNVGRSFSFSRREDGKMPFGFNDSEKVEKPLDFNSSEEGGESSDLKDNENVEKPLGLGDSEKQQQEPSDLQEHTNEQKLSPKNIRHLPCMFWFSFILGFVGLVLISSLFWDGIYTPSVPDKIFFFDEDARNNQNASLLMCQMTPPDQFYVGPYTLASNITSEKLVNCTLSATPALLLPKVESTDDTIASIVLTCPKGDSQPSLDYINLSPGLYGEPSGTNCTLEQFESENIAGNQFKISLNCSKNTDNLTFRPYALRTSLDKTLQAGNCIPKDIQSLCPIRNTLKSPIFTPVFNTFWDQNAVIWSLASHSLETMDFNCAFQWTLLFGNSDPITNGTLNLYQCLIGAAASNGNSTIELLPEQFETVIDPKQPVSKDYHHRMKKAMLPSSDQEDDATDYVEAYKGYVSLCEATQQEFIRVVSLSESLSAGIVHGGMAWVFAPLTIGIATLLILKNAESQTNIIKRKDKNPNIPNKTMNDPSLGKNPPPSTQDPNHTTSSPSLKRDPPPTTQDLNDTTDNPLKREDSKGKGHEARPDPNLHLLSEFSVSSNSIEVPFLH